MNMKELVEKLASTIISFRIGVSAGFSRKFKTLLKCIAEFTYPSSCAVRMSVMNRRAEKPEYTL